MREINAETLDIGWITICTALLIVMHGGFLCLESGLVRSKNSINVAIKNLIDFCFSSVIFFVFGFAIMYGASQGGWYGTSGYFLEGVTAPKDLSFFLFQMIFCGTTATIVSGAVAERMNFSGYVLVVAVVAGLVYPLLGHWVWSGLQNGQATGWLAQNGFIDFAGSTVVHSVGGWCALAAALIVGPRMGRFQKNKNQRLNGHNLPLAVLGVVLLWFGWIGFNGGSTLGLSADIPKIVVNTCLAAAFGGFVALAISWVVCQRSDVISAMNGVVAGLVAISASCNIVTPSGAVLIGCIGACICFAATRLIERWKIDDAIGAFPAHACAGIWGTIAVAILAPLSAFGDGVTRFEQITIQLTGVAVCFGWSFGVGYVAFWSINRIFKLRVSEEDEKIGLNVSEHNASTEILDLLSEIEAHQKEGSNKLIEVDQHTEAGQIAKFYNHMAGTAAREKEAANLVRKSEERFRRIIDTTNDAFIAINQEGVIQRWNAAAETLFNLKHDDAMGRHVSFVIRLAKPTQTSVDEMLFECARKGDREQIQLVDDTGKEFPVEISASVCKTEDEVSANLFIQDIANRLELQQQLSQAQKLESIGQLAAGIAHEINTPIQFFGDNTSFLKDAFDDMNQLTELFESFLKAEKNNEDTTAIIEELESTIEEVDLPYLKEEIPLSISQSLEGVQRVASIVRAMKQFSHPGGTNMEKVDLNSAIENTITVSRNEWKYVAEIERDFDKSLPHVSCYPNEFNQVVLNMIVNAAHAIQDKLGPNTEEKGTITLRTRCVDDQAELRICDTGSGIPEDVRKKIFDPFFTTKEVGRGTGQGLAIAYKAIVERHSGSIRVESEVGEGTTFVISVPVNAQAHSEAPEELVAT